MRAVSHSELHTMRCSVKIHFNLSLRRVHVYLDSNPNKETILIVLKYTWGAMFHNVE